jgi:hypothetical protein
MNETDSDTERDDASFSMFGEDEAPAKPGAYEVLARKYRPTRFDDMIGQEAMVRTLTQRHRRRAAGPRLHADRRARRRQDHDGAHAGARHELHRPPTATRTSRENY